jgi:hypothetical protein
MYLVFCQILTWPTLLTHSRSSLHAELLALRHEDALCRYRHNAFYAAPPVMPRGLVTDVW